jgi:hypothetical protein
MFIIIIMILNSNPSYNLFEIYVKTVWKYFTFIVWSKRELELRKKILIYYKILLIAKQLTNSKLYIVFSKILGNLSQSSILNKWTSTVTSLSV